MKSKRLTSSLVALAAVAGIALGYAQWAKHARGAVATTPAGAPSSPVSGSAAASALAAMGNNPCAGAADLCACATDRGAELLLACFSERALQVVSRAPASCTTPAFLGVRAEALAALERGDEATAVAQTALRAEPKNRFARRALAIAAIQGKRFEQADTALKELLGEDAKDVDSAFYAALSERKRDHYNRAREGFLAVLRLDRQHIDARFNLVTLTASAGAEQEAEHDYQELSQITPVGDPRLIAARAALRSAPKDAPAELPILHEGSGPDAGSSSVVPLR